MSHYHFDRRDIDFVLFEQLGLSSLAEHPLHEDFTQEVCEMVLTEAGKFAQEYLAPTNKLSDREGCKLVGDKIEVPECFRDAYKRFSSAGWVGPTHSIELGGQNMPKTLNLAATELFIGACTSFFFFPGLTTSAGHLIEAFGSKDLVERFVKKMYTGEWAGTMCLTEPQAGSAVGDLRTSATPNEDGTYNVVGTKIFITCGDHDLTKNIVHLVLARVPGDPDGIKGISLFAVPKVWVNDDGSLGELNDVIPAGIEHKMGLHGCPTCVMNFGDNNSCRGFLVGERCQGIIAMFQMMNEARIACGLQGVSSANAAYLSALNYSKERVQGTNAADFKNPNAKRVPIIDHPDVRRMLATMKAYAEGTRALLYKASFQADLFTISTDKATKAKAKMTLDLMTPICKAYATDKAFNVTELAIQTYGGYGYCSEYPVEQYMRDVKIASIYEGTNGIQAIDLLARKLTMKNGALFLTYLQEINGFIEANQEHKTLGDAVTSLDKAKNKLAEVAFTFSSGGGKDIEYSLLHAVPFLEMFGDVMVAQLLIEQALIADKKLAEIDEHDKDARFYRNKLKTARFFAHNILPRTIANAISIRSKDRSALEIEY